MKDELGKMKDEGGRMKIALVLLFIPHPSAFILYCWHAYCF
jgi:hypothetical protein